MMAKTISQAGGVLGWTPLLSLACFLLLLGMNRIHLLSGLLEVAAFAGYLQSRVGMAQFCS
jgi:hypothetical protein